MRPDLDDWWEPSSPDAPCELCGYEYAHDTACAWSPPGSRLSDPWPEHRKHYFSVPGCRLCEIVAEQRPKWVIL